MVVKLWTKLTAMYGHKFTAQFGKSPDETWITCLVGIGGREIANGLNACLEEHPVWPPGAAQFRALCIGEYTDDEGNKSKWQHNSAAYLEWDDPKHPRNDPTSAEYVKPETKLIGNDEAESVGKSELSKMKGLFQ